MYKKFYDFSGVIEYVEGKVHNDFLYYLSLTFSLSTIYPLSIYYYISRFLPVSHQSTKCVDDFPRSGVWPFVVTRYLRYRTIWWILREDIKVVEGSQVWRNIRHFYWFILYKYRHIKIKFHCRKKSLRYFFIISVFSESIYR